MTVDKTIKISVGCDQFVEIDKEYGPAIFPTIKVVADFHSYSWIIYVEEIIEQDEKDDVIIWKEAACISATTAFPMRRKNKQ